MLKNRVIKNKKGKNNQGHVTFFEWIIWFFLIRNLIIFGIICNYYISGSKGLKFLGLV